MGELLTPLRKACRRGSWLPFIAEHFPGLTERRIARALDAYRNRQLRHSDPAGLIDRINGCALKRQQRGFRKALAINTNGSQRKLSKEDKERLQKICEAACAGSAKWLPISACWKSREP
jgi:hypothetical protein